MKRVRVGHKMHFALRVIGVCGHLPSKAELARWVGPYRSLRYGYKIIDRCLSAGLLALDPYHPGRSHNGLGAVVLTDAGRRRLEDAKHG